MDQRTCTTITEGTNRSILSTVRKGQSIYRRWFKTQQEETYDS